MEGPAVEERLVIFLRFERRAHLLPGHELQRICEIALHHLLRALQTVGVVVADHADFPRDRGGRGDIEFFDLRADDFRALDRHAIERVRLFPPDHAFDMRKARRIARPDEAAVAAGRAPRHPLGLDEGDAEAGAGEVEGGGEARQPPADDADIRRSLALQRSARRPVCDGAAVIRVDIGHGADPGYPELVRRRGAIREAAGSKIPCTK